MVAWGAIGSAVGSLAKELFSSGANTALGYLQTNKQYKNQSKLNKQTYQYNLKLQNHQNKFSQSMFDQSAKLASQAHQIEVKDLRSSGLNPILSATGGNGASVVSPLSGGSAGMSGGSASTGEVGKIDLINAFNSSKQVRNDTKRVENETKMVDPTIGKLNAESNNAKANTDYTNEQHRQFGLYNPMIQQAQLKVLKSQEAFNDANTAKALISAKNETNLTNSQIQTNKSVQSSNYASASSHPYKDVSKNIIQPLVNSAKSGNLTYKNIQRNFNRQVHHFFTGTYGHY